MQNDFERSYYENPSLWVPERFATLYTQRVKLALDWIPSDVRSALDVGCGNGIFTNQLIATKSAHLVIGVDRSLTALKYVYPNRGQADINRLPFRDHGFDIVVAMEVLEHIPYRLYTQSLAELVRVAKKYILITVPYNENRAFKSVICPECGCSFHPNFHARSYNRYDVENLLDDWDSFQPVKVQGVVPVKEIMFSGLWKTVRRAYLRRRDFPPNAICPQCGYSTDSPLKNNSELTMDTNNRGTRKLKSLMRYYWPKITKASWWMALYAREQ
jgi:SAM-dependent methyltransferase